MSIDSLNISLMIQTAAINNPNLGLQISSLLGLSGH